VPRARSSEIARFAHRAPAIVSIASDELLPGDGDRAPKMR
jgi:hypothetical protein